MGPSHSFQISSPQSSEPQASFCSQHSFYGLHLPWCPHFWEESQHMTGNIPSQLPQSSVAPSRPWTFPSAVGASHIPSVCSAYGVSSVLFYTPSYFISCFPSPARIWVPQGQPFFPLRERSAMGLFHNDHSKFIKQRK